MSAHRAKNGLKSRFSFEEHDETGPWCDCKLIKRPWIKAGYTIKKFRILGYFYALSYVTLCLLGNVVTGIIYFTHWNNDNDNEFQLLTNLKTILDDDNHTSNANRMLHGNESIIDYMDIKMEYDQPFGTNASIFADYNGIFINQTTDKVRKYVRWLHINLTTGQSHLSDRLGVIRLMCNMLLLQFTIAIYNYNLNKILIPKNFCS